MTDMTSEPTQPRARRPRPKALSLTDRAADRVKEIMADSREGDDGEILGVRVGVRNGGCAGMAYTMDYVREVNPMDEMVEDKDVRIYIDPKAILFLLGSTMDYKTDTFSAQFVFDNPNQVDACGCGESVNLKAAEVD